MLVDVILMRCEGKKLPTDAIRAATPLRGYLSMHTFRNRIVHPNDEPPWLVEAAVTVQPSRPSLSNRPLATLARAWVKDSLGEHMLILGRESYGNPSAHQWHPQAWWLRVVDGRVAEMPAPLVQLTEMA
jgi:hypothetical protein